MTTFSSGSRLFVRHALHARACAFVRTSVRACVTGGLAFGITTYSTPASHAASPLPPITITNGIIVPIPKNPTHAAGFFSITNNDQSDHLLNGIHSPLCTNIVAHHTKQDESGTTNDLFTHLALPHNATMIFPKDGYHLICLGVQRPLRSEESIPVTFSFRDVPEVTVSFTAKN